jgi:MFS family permease
VRERKKEAAQSQSAGAAPVLKEPLSQRFWLFLAVSTLFTLGNSSDFFLILRAQNKDGTFHTPLVQVAIMLVLFNLVYALLSTPMGVLSDKIGRRRVLATGWTIYVLVYVGFALAASVWQVWLLFLAYGIYYGMCHGVANAFVADLVPAARRGTAYGIYQGVTGLALLPASVIGGLLWNVIKTSPGAATFYFGAGMAFLALVGILFLVKESAQ